MSAIKVSIVIPVYNCELYLERTLESVRNQTLKEIEIIIVDDGSTDNSGKIADDISNNDDRITVIHKQNGGVTSARLEGMKKSNGEYIGFVDGDDIIDSDMYERLYRNAIENNADISHCGYAMVFPNRVDYYYNTGKKVIQNKENGVSDLMKGEFIEPGLCNKIFSKNICETFLNTIQMDCSIRINEDLLMNYYLFKISELSIYEDFCPYQYMVQGTSAVNTGIKEHHINDPLRVLNIIWEYEKDNENLSSIVLRRKARQHVNHAVLSLPNNKELQKKYNILGKKGLKEVFLKVINNNDIDMRTKMIVSFVRVSPFMYRLIHDVYSKLTGLDRIYSID